MIYHWESSARTATITCDGQLVAQIDRAIVRERADVEILGRPWQFGISGTERIATTVDRPELTCRAYRPSVWRRRWIVQCGQASYEIAPASFASSTFDVLLDGTSIGESGRAGFWSTRPTLTVPDSVPAPDAIFLLWIAFLMRKRAASAAAASS